MGRKGKTQKHTTKEINSKIKAAKERAGAAGGGGDGKANRQAAWTKASVCCDICKTVQPSFKTMKIHFESKHPKETFPEAEYEAKFTAVKASVKPDKKGKKPVAKKTGFSFPG